MTPKAAALTEIITYYYGPTRLDVKSPYDTDRTVELSINP